MKRARGRKRPLYAEGLEARQLLSSVPFGAAAQDTAEFLLGDVNVNVVFLESNGAIDADTEQWNEELATGVKGRIEEGLQWWTDTLALHSDKHYLNFNVDYTYADDPVEVSYEPISRGSQAFTLWIEEFFRATDTPSSPGFTTEIRNFNHQTRIENDANWSFTIFVVNADNDPNDRFGDANAQGTVFQRAFAYPGGQFIVMPHSRPAGTVAHEVGHMFWAFDEYSNSDSYSSRRGYYATQNTNAYSGNPDTSQREPSIMASVSSPFANHQISQSARETIGWRDSDGDGIFDVLDVDHTLDANVTYDAITNAVSIAGTSSINTLANQNPAGFQNDITINRITSLQYRIDGGEWIDLTATDGYTVDINSTLEDVPANASVIEFQTIDDRIGVTSNVLSLDLPARSTTPVDPEVPTEPTSPGEPTDEQPTDPTDEQPTDDPNAPRQNPDNSLDVNGDGHVTAIDVLNVIVSLNTGNTFDDVVAGPPFLDVTGDGVVSARDALTVINHINRSARVLNVDSPAGEFDEESSSTELAAATTEMVVLSPVLENEVVVDEPMPVSETAPQSSTLITAVATTDVPQFASTPPSTSTLAVWALFSRRPTDDSDPDFWQ